MTNPDEIAVQNLQLAVPYPFQDGHLFDSERQAGMNLASEDASSLQKFRLVSIATAQFLSFRAIREAFILRNSDRFANLDDMTQGCQRLEGIGDAILRTCQAATDLPAYVDLEYFIRWKRRYTDVVGDYGAYGLRDATVLAAYRHGTFAHEQEPAIRAEEIDLMRQLAIVTDNYINGLRNLLGPAVLNVAGHGLQHTTH